MHAMSGKTVYAYGKRKEIKVVTIQRLQHYEQLIPTLPFL